MSSYVSSLLGWLDSSEASGMFVPADARSYIMNARSDSERYSFALGLYNGLQMAGPALQSAQPKKEEKPRPMYFVTEESSDGSIFVRNIYGPERFYVNRKGGNLFDIGATNPELLTMFGPRGGMGGIFNMVNDGSYLRDLRAKAAD